MSVDDSASGGSNWERRIFPLMMLLRYLVGLSLIQDLETWLLPRELWREKVGFIIIITKIYTGLGGFCCAKLMGGKEVFRHPSRT